MYWTRTTMNCVTINASYIAIVLDGEKMFATAASNAMRISSAALIPPTLNTARVGLTCC